MLYVALIGCALVLDAIHAIHVLRRERETRQRLNALLVRRTTEAPLTLLNGNIRGS